MLKSEKFIKNLNRRVTMKSKRERLRTIKYQILPAIKITGATKEYKEWLAIRTLDLMQDIYTEELEKFRILFKRIEG